MPLRLLKDRLSVRSSPGSSHCSGRLRVGTRQQERWRYFKFLDDVVLSAGRMSKHQSRSHRAFARCAMRPSTIGGTKYMPPS